MPAIRFTRLVIEHTPLVVDSDHMSLSIGQQMDNMIRASMERGEVIHEVALAFEDATDFYSFRDHYMIDERAIRKAARHSEL